MSNDIDQSTALEALGFEPLNITRKKCKSKTNIQSLEQNGFNLLLIYFNLLQCTSFTLYIEN